MRKTLTPSQDAALRAHLRTQVGFSVPGLSEETLDQLQEAMVTSAKIIVDTKVGEFRTEIKQKVRQSITKAMAVTVLISWAGVYAYHRFAKKAR